MKQPTDIDRIVASDLSDQDAVSAIVATGQAGRSAALRYVLIGRGRFTGTPVGNEEVPKSVQHWLAPPGRRSTGQEIFDAKTEAEQNEMVGPGAAQMIRDGVPANHIYIVADPEAFGNMSLGKEDASATDRKVTIFFSR